MTTPGEVAARIARAWGVPGGAVAVADADGRIEEWTFGVADLASGAPVASGHLFEIGSISKITTALAILTLVDDGLLRLDQPVSELLDGLPAGLRGPELTLERLLSHTAGLVASIDALPDEAGQVAGYPGEPAAPGVFHYSNVGYLLLGLVGARAGGRPFPELVRERVLLPAGMRSTLPRVTYDDLPLLARGTSRVADDRPWVPGDPLQHAPVLEVAGADGSLASPVADLVRLGRLLLARGATDHGARVISEDSFARMTGALAPEGEDVVVVPGAAPTLSSRYGLGVNVERTPAGVVLSHGGGMVGYASFLHVDVATGRVVAVVTTADGDSPVAEAIARTIAAGGDDALDPALWASGAGEAVPRSAHGRTGRFTASGSAGERVLEVTATPDAPGRVRLDVALDGVTAPLLWGWGDRAVTRHPALRGFALTVDPAGWAWGPLLFRREPLAAEPAPPADAVAHLGHYRSYSPWFRDFRVVARDGGLWLIASGGVEAPSADTPLVPLGDGLYRVGADPALPERIRFAPPVDGSSPWAERDGCRYSRAFTA